MGRQFFLLLALAISTDISAMFNPQMGCFEPANLKCMNSVSGEDSVQSKPRKHDDSDISIDSGFNVTGLEEASHNFSKAIEDMGDRLGVLGPEVQLQDWEQDPQWVGNKDGWTEEEIAKYVTATEHEDYDDPETFIKKDLPMKEQYISPEVQNIVDLWLTSSAEIFLHRNFFLTQMRQLKDSTGFCAKSSRCHSKFDHQTSCRLSAAPGGACAYNSWYDRFVPRLFI